MSIFHHVDRDGDELEVLAGTHLEFHMAGKVGAGIAVHVDRDAALRLHAALGEWLYPVHTPEWANKSLIEQMIEKAVKDQVAAVLPLHLKPVAYVHGRNCPGQLFCQDANGVQVIDCQDNPDPEPHDVGHAEPSGPCGALLEPGQRLIEVHDCGYVWAMHKAAKPEPHDVGHSEPYSPPLHLATESECRGDSQNLCIARHLSEGESKPDTLFAPGARAQDRQALGLEPESIDHGRLMSELSRRIRPRPICVSCGHGWGQHYSGICWGEPGATNCTCTRERPGTAGTS